MIRKFAFVLGILVLSLLAALTASKGSAKEKKNSESYVPNFSSTPEVQSKPGSAGVTFALGSVSFTTDTPNYAWFMAPEFAHLDQAIKDDLTRMLLAKGFTVSGPVSSGEMTYSDKKAIDLLLETTFGIATKKTDTTVKKAFLTTTTTYHFTHYGKITLEIREPVTRELLWKNSITFTSPNPPDVSWWPTLAKDLEKQYPDLMARIARLIDPEEMRILKKQALELKRKKGY